MAQQNIDFGAFPDDPSADAIRSAFQKVQENFDEIFTGVTNASVSSVNRSAGAGITVNAPTGNVVVTANIANVTVSSPNLLFGTSLGVLASSTVYPSSTQTLYIVVPNTFSIGNIVLSGSANISGNLSVGGNVDLGNAIVANYFIGSGNNLSNIQGANVTGIVPSATTAITVTSNAQPNITSLGTLTSLSVTGNITSGNATLGNSATANYFIGSGNNLSNIQAANITGTAANSNYAAYAGDVVNASQSNITSVGTLTSVSVSGNANIGNIGTGIITATGNVTGANLFTGGLLSVTGNANIGNIGTEIITATGNVTGANLITGGLLSVTGNANVGNVGTIGVYATTLSATGNANVGNIGATAVVATTLDGSLTTNAQPNITSTGILTSISVSGNANIGNIGTGIITATGNITGANLSTSGNLSVTGNATIGNVSVTGNLTAGNIVVDSIVNGNSNVDITNLNGNITMGVNGNADVFIATSNGVIVTGTLNASANITSPQLISNIATGTAPFIVSSTTQVANLSVATAGSANLAGTVTTNAQPNITSVGNLTGLTSNGIIDFINSTNVSLGSNAIVHITGGLNSQVLSTDGSGNLSWSTYSGSPIAGSNTEVQFNDTTGNLGASANFTFNKTTNTLSVTNLSATTATISTINATTIVANGNINGLNLGTGGNITASGNIQGAYILGNGSQLSGLPSGTGIANGTSSVTVPTSNGNVVIASAGSTIANITGTGINVAGTLSVSGDANVGNIGAINGVFTNISGNGSALTAITGANVTGAVPYATTANAVALANVSGAGNIASLNTDGNSSNILYGNGVFSSAPVTYGNSNVATFLASFGSNTITTTGNISIGYIIGNGQALTGITGSNVTGQVGNALVAGTVYTNAQPNITSLGTLTSVTVSGNANIGNIGTGGLITATGNITGGNIVTAGEVSATGNVAGNFFIGNGSQLTGIDATSIQNGDSNVKVFANANVTVSSAGNANIVVVTGTGANIAGTLSSSGNINGANIITGGSVSATGNANVGNLGTTQLTATGNVAFSGANVSLGAVGNLKITGGTANYFLQTDGSGNLTWATVSSTVPGAFTFTQASPSTTWLINHNLGYQYVNIQLVDSTGNSFTGRYNYPVITFNNTTHCTVVFDSAQAGYAAVTSGGGEQGPKGDIGNANVGGSNTEVQFNDAGVFGGSSAFTFNKSSNLVSMTSLSITANANVGNIGGSAGVFSTITGNLTTPAQSNITAVGTLVSLSVSGNANIGNIGTGGLVTAVGNVTGANIIATTYNLTGVNTSISAAGSSQGDATILTKAFNVVSTVASGTGVVLPTAVAGMRVTIVNTSANTVIVYPASGGAINSLATNAGFSLPTVGRLDYIATSTTQWYAMGAIYV